MHKFPNIAIIGAGPVGLACALLLAKHHPQPERITVFKESRANAKPDPRTLAINFGSESLLRQLNAWPGDKLGEITTVHVSQKGRLGSTRIRHHDYQAPRLGSVVHYEALLHSLSQALTQTPIQIREGSRANVSTLTETYCEVIQNDLREKFDLVIQAEGGVFGEQTRHQTSRHYQQWAVLATIKASHPLPGVAWERFTREGPLALLPHPDHSHDYALVWCVPKAKAEHLIKAQTQDFNTQLQEDFGERLGKLSLNSDRACFELGMNFKQHLVTQRLVNLGNAAQTLHPVSGQGLNLGLRDAAELALSLKNIGLVNIDELLARFQQQRRYDRYTSLAVTDTLARLFTSGLPPIEHACGLGLLALDQDRRAQSPLAQQLLYGTRC